jgi:hypothetical protein
MADINSKFDIGVTTGPIRGSRKVHVGAKSGSGVRVAMREIDLEGGEPSVRVYDTSGPYTDQQGPAPATPRMDHGARRCRGIRCARSEAGG